MKIVGITGSIGMGKTTVLQWLKREGWPCLNSDEVVHRLLRDDPHLREAIQHRLFGESSVGDTAAFLERLRRAVHNQPQAYDVLEEILHPYVFREYEVFIRQQRSRGCRCVFLEVPLLFEVGLASLFDWVIVVSSSQFLQKYRTMKRPGMTQKRLSVIQKRQLPQGGKRAGGDYVIFGGSVSKLAPQIQHVLNQILSQ